MSKYVPNSFQVANAFVDEAMSKISDASVKSIWLLTVKHVAGQKNVMRFHLRN